MNLTKQQRKMAHAMGLSEDELAAAHDERGNEAYYAGARDHVARDTNAAGRLTAEQRKIARAMELSDEEFLAAARSIADEEEDDDEPPRAAVARPRAQARPPASTPAPPDEDDAHRPEVVQRSDARLRELPPEVRRGIEAARGRGFSVR